MAKKLSFLVEFNDNFILLYHFYIYNGFIEYYGVCLEDNMLTTNHGDIIDGMLESNIIHFIGDIVVYENLIIGNDAIIQDFKIVHSDSKVSFCNNTYVLYNGRLLHHFECSSFYKI